VTTTTTPRETIVKKIILSATVALGVLSGASAAAQTPTPCEQGVADFTSTEKRMVRLAGSPSFVCSDPGGGNFGRFDEATNTVYVTPDASVALARRTVAHEVGHAWIERHGSRYADFARIRGLTFDSRLLLSDPEAAKVQVGRVIEDYAETFAYSIGWFEVVAGVAIHDPYAFENEAGFPTEAQMDALRAAKLLPGLPVPSLSISFG
jgi:hypothetical protein